MLWQQFGQAFSELSSNSDGSTKTESVLHHQAYFHGRFGPPVLKAAGAHSICAKVPFAIALVGCPSCGGQRRVLRRGKPPRKHPAATAGAAAAWRLRQRRLQWSHRF